MQNEITLNLRKFPTVIRDKRTGATWNDSITLSQTQMEAAKIVCYGSTKMIECRYEREGLKVLEIGTPHDMTITLDLDKLWERETDE